MGQLALGFAADRIGRKWGSVATGGRDADGRHPAGRRQRPGRPRPVHHVHHQPGAFRGVAVCAHSASSCSALLARRMPSMPVRWLDYVTSGTTAEVRRDPSICSCWLGNHAAGPGSCCEQLASIRNCLKGSFRWTLYTPMSTTCFSRSRLCSASASAGSTPSPPPVPVSGQKLTSTCSIGAARPSCSPSACKVLSMRTAGPQRLHHAASLDMFNTVRSGSQQLTASVAAITVSPPFLRAGACAVPKCSHLLRLLSAKSGTLM